MRNSIASVGPGFSTHRMLKQYVERYYVPGRILSRRLNENGFAKADALAEWEARVRSGWSSIALTASGPSSGEIKVGETVTVGAVLKPGLLRPDDLAVELVYGQGASQGLSSARFVPMTLVKERDGECHYEVTFAFPESGAIAYGVRVRPDHPDIPDPFALCLVKWA
jgi:starch phosphorylase